MPITFLPSSRLPQSQRIFTRLIGGIFIYLMVIPFGKWGLFFDGITYSTISRNLAIGLGSFWKPFYTPEVFPAFFEHPPLVFGLQSLFFRLLGEGLWVEKLYTGIIFLFTLLTLYKIWKIAFPNSLQGYWMVLLFFSLPAVNQNAYRDNFLEGTQSLFVLFAVLAIFRGDHASSLGRKLLFLTGAAGFLVAGFLSKGPNALFPLIIPVLMEGCRWILARKDQEGSKSINYHRLLYYSLFLLLVTGGILSVFWLFEESKNFLNIWLKNQVGGSLWGDRKGNNLSRFYFFRFFFLQTVLTVAVFFSLFWICRKYRCWKIYRVDKYYGLLFFLIFLTASLPLMMSQRIAHHYLVPSLPWLALSAAACLHSSVAKLLEKWENKKILLKQAASVSLISLLLLSVMAVMQFGTYTDKNYRIVIEDVKKLEKVYGLKNQPLTVCPSFLEDWRLIAYAYRIEQIWLVTEATDFFLSDRSCNVDKNRYRKIDELFFGYDFFEEKPEFR